MSNWIIFTPHSCIGNSCWNGAISFETFVEREISCCIPRFPLVLTGKFHSLYVESESWGESEILENRCRGSEILERSESGVGVGYFRKVGVGSRKFWKVFLASNSTTLPHNAACKLTTTWHQGPWTWLLCGVSVLPENKLPLQELNQLIEIELLTSCFLENFSS